MDVSGPKDNPAKQQYELDLDGSQAVLLYRRTAESITLVHTEVPDELRGRGLGGVLAKHALEAARADGLKVVPKCPFVRSFIEKHPEYQSLVA